MVPTSELEDEAYLRNSGDRCYFCKSALMHALEAISSQAAGATEILVGVNTDDLGDHRPGQQAVRERGGRWPLVEVRLSKAEIRWLSRELGCRPGTPGGGLPVVPHRLRGPGDRGRAAADRDLRGGPQGAGAVGPGQGPGSGKRPGPDRGQPGLFGLVMERRREVAAALKDAGFVFVTLDLEGYQQGSHNLTLRRRPVPQPLTHAAGDEHDAGTIVIP